MESPTQVLSTFGASVAMDGMIAPFTELNLGDTLQSFWPSTARRLLGEAVAPMSALQSAVAEVVGLETNPVVHIFVVIHRDNEFVYHTCGSGLKPLGTGLVNGKSALLFLLSESPLLSGRKTEKTSRYLGVVDTVGGWFEFDRIEAGRTLSSTFSRLVDIDAEFNVERDGSMTPDYGSVLALKDGHFRIEDRSGMLFNGSTLGSMADLTRGSQVFRLSFPQDERIVLESVCGLDGATVLLITFRQIVLAVAGSVGKLSVRTDQQCYNFFDIGSDMKCTSFPADLLPTITVPWVFINQGGLAGRQYDCMILPSLGRECRLVNPSGTSLDAIWSASSKPNGTSGGYPLLGQSVFGIDFSEDISRGFVIALAETSIVCRFATGVVITFSHNEGGVAIMFDDYSVEVTVDAKGNSSVKHYDRRLAESIVYGECKTVEHAHVTLSPPAISYFEPLNLLISGKRGGAPSEPRLYDWEGELIDGLEWTATDGGLYGDSLRLGLYRFEQLNQELRFVSLLGGGTRYHIFAKGGNYILIGDTSPDEAANDDGVTIHVSGLNAEMEEGPVLCDVYYIVASPCTPNAWLFDYLVEEA